SCVKVGKDLPLEVVTLVGCGVPTGWGTAVNAGGVRPGDTVVIYGIGGVGINAVQGAAYAGARHIVAVDPMVNKREAAHALGAFPAPSLGLTLFAKRIRGARSGGGNPFEEIPRMLDMYRPGKLKRDELVTRRYSLAEVQQAYQDLVDGKNIRGVIIHEH